MATWVVVSLLPLLLSSAVAVATAGSGSTAAYSLGGGGGNNVSSFITSPSWPGLPPCAQLEWWPASGEEAEAAEALLGSALSLEQPSVGAPGTSRPSSGLLLLQTLLALAMAGQRHEHDERRSLGVSTIVQEALRVTHGGGDGDGERRDHRHRHRHDEANGHEERAGGVECDARLQRIHPGLAAKARLVRGFVDTLYHHLALPRLRAGNRQQPAHHHYRDQPGPPGDMSASHCQVYGERHPSNGADRKLRVVVVGGGPAGLLSALEAYKAGARVCVVEKRLAYTRDTWFDIYDQPFSRGLTTLESWGFGWLAAARRLLTADLRGRSPDNGLLEFQDWRAPSKTTRQQPQPQPPPAGEAAADLVGAITVRARVLEQFLAKVLQTVGVPILYAYEFVAHCPASAAAASGRALFHATAGVPAAHYAHPRANDSALFWCSRPLSVLTRRFHARTDAPDSTSPAAFLALEFDVLVGADGTQSRVRQFSRVPYRQQNSFLLGHHHVTLPDLHQTTLILNFAPTTPPAAASKASSRAELGVPAEPSPECPRVNERVGQDFAGLAIDGVTSVFKRFYQGHCHMQVLFSREEGLRIEHRYREERGGGVATNTAADVADREEVFRLWCARGSDDATVAMLRVGEGEERGWPWPKLLEIVNTVLLRKHRSAASLQRALLLRPTGRQASPTPVPLVEQQPHPPREEGASVATAQYDIALFPIIVCKADITALAAHPAPASTSNALIVLIGDAALSAHYRLGVGINAAFESAWTFGKFVGDLQHLKARTHQLDAGAQIEALRRSYEDEVQARLARMVQFQVSTMALETVCDMAVFFDQTAPSQFDSQLVFAKDRRLRDYVGGSGGYVGSSSSPAAAKPLSPVQVLQLCPALRPFLSSRHEQQSPPRGKSR